jgi:ribonuclease VapC
VIVDTSALVAIAYREPGAAAIMAALVAESGTLPAPALLEFYRVTALAGGSIHPAAEALLSELVAGGLAILPFNEAQAAAAAQANAAWGKGNGAGGRLNIIDLMIYAAAKTSSESVLCTGRDFAATDIAIHPASRPS